MGAGVLEMKKQGKSHFHRGATDEIVTVIVILAACDKEYPPASAKQRPLLFPGGYGPCWQGGGPYGQKCCSQSQDAMGLCIAYVSEQVRFRKRAIASGKDCLVAPRVDYVKQWMKCVT